MLCGQIEKLLSGMCFKHFIRGQYFNMIDLWQFEYVTNVFYLCVILCNSQSEREEFESEYKQKYERERTLLTEENKKLSSELDKVRHTHTHTRMLTFVYTHTHTLLTLNNPVTVKTFIFFHPPHLLPLLLFPLF